MNRLAATTAVMDRHGGVTFTMNRRHWAIRLLAAMALLAVVVSPQAASVQADGTAPAPPPISLVGQIIAVNGPVITLACGAPHQCTVYLTSHTTYWEHLTAATSNDVAVGSQVQVWALHRPDGAYTAVKMYFKVILATGIVQNIGLRSITVGDVTVAGHHHSSLTCRYGETSGFYEGPTVVSAHQLLTQMRISVVGYIHHDDTMYISQLWITGVSVAGFVVRRDPMSLTIATRGQQRVVLYLTTNTLIWRDRTALSPAMVGVGSKLQAYGYPEPDNSVHTTAVHLVPVSFTGIISPIGGKLILDVGHAHQYEVRYPARAPISYRHGQRMTWSDVRPGSKVTISAFPEPGHALLVVNCVVWTLPQTPVHARRR